MLLVLRLLLVVVALPLAAAAAGPFLTVTGQKETLSLTAADFAALPHTDIVLPAEDDSPERHFSGVPVKDLLVRVGAPLGDKMKRSAMMLGVVVHCKDGYSVLFALAEFDDAFSSRTILLADKEDGAPLPPSAAPLRIVAPGDKRGARSCKQVVAVEVVSLAKP